MDVHDKETRSYNMSCIKGKNTKPEETVRKALFSKGFRYRKNDKRLPGTPDIVLPKYKTVIFVNGCFWHVHKNCRYFVVPKTNTEFWINKIKANAERDNHKAAQLEELGWRVITIWECELKKENIDKTIEKLVKQIKQSSKENEFYSFAVRFYDMLNDPKADYLMLENDLGKECGDLGFDMDAGESFINQYSKDAFHKADTLERIINDVDSVELLGNGIYSKWRYITHWAESSLLSEDNKKWFLIVLNRLIELTS